MENHRFTAENTAILMVDYSTGFINLFGSHTVEENLRNTVALAKVARAFNTGLVVSLGRGQRPYPELVQAIGDQPIIYHGGRVQRLREPRCPEGGRSDRPLVPSHRRADERRLRAFHCARRASARLRRRARGGCDRRRDAGSPRHGVLTDDAGGRRADHLAQLRRRVAIRLGQRRHRRGIFQSHRRVLSVLQFGHPS